jgi:hypothetical protein
MTWSLAAWIGGSGIAVTAAAGIVWLALRLVATTRQLGEASLAATVADAKRGLAVLEATQARAELAAAREEKAEALRQATARDAVIDELQDLLNECRDPVVVRARLSDILSRRPNLPH